MWKIWHNKIFPKILLLWCTLTFVACQNKVWSIKRLHHIECEGVGFKFMPSKIYPKYVKFRDNHRKASLLNFIDHPNLSLRAYTYWALMEKMDENDLRIVEMMLQDTSEIIERCGCTSRRERLVTSAYNQYLGSLVNYIEDEGTLRFGKEPIKLYRVDSLILFQESVDPDLLEMALANRDYQSEEIIIKIISLAFQDDIIGAGEYIKRNMKKPDFVMYREKIMDLDEGLLTIEGRKLLREIRQL